ncbi:ricin-type beta-trefoil lectin domain protein [Acaryochloris sp. IP29b_bin.148]|uniref:RICIN domain-containing protein n=1 Tax=Acaryochloris sp. IP29b_bin.148 TaxID=2969218 RepID=UPI00263771F2|nr:ricin-type beta-trefoil lectin domain protein [Acaryochloris sp. IP29b_bin.148]
MNKLVIWGIITCGLMVGATSACQSTQESVDNNQPAEESADNNPSTQESAANNQSAEKLVEVKLNDDIDESRGYCLDIAGGRGTKAPIEKGLQAHTCYDYTGGLLEDQSFDASLIEQGQFKIPYFDVCMTASSTEAGANLELATCDSTDTQKFSLESNGNLTLQAAPELCVTVSSTEKKEGRGATPVHVMRPLSLQPCSADNVEYQAWSTFSL